LNFFPKSPAEPAILVKKEVTAKVKKQKLWHPSPTFDDGHLPRRREAERTFLSEPHPVPVAGPLRKGVERVWADHVDEEGRRKRKGGRPASEVYIDGMVARARCCNHSGRLRWKKRK